LAKAIGVGLVGAFGGLAFAMKNSIDKFNEQIAAEAQLNSVLKSTKNAAGLTAKEVKKMARELQKVTTFGDEAVLTAQNLLLTFTNIGKETFPEATQIVLDMSVALGQDLKSSAVQVGKALQDPILGVTALRRVGVNFTEQQQEMIKTMVATGKTMEAQKFILKELDTEFGGSAKEQAETFAGRIKHLKNAFGDFTRNNWWSIIKKQLGPFIEKIKRICK